MGKSKRDTFFLSNSVPYHQAGGNLFDAIKFMLEQLQELKWLGASIPAQSLLLLAHH